MWLWEVLLPGRRLSSEGGRTEELTPGQQGWSRAGAKDLLSGRQSREETMEPRPASPCTEHTLRQGLLISALLLTFWNPVTTAKLTIESVPNYAVEGKNLLLQVHNLPDKLQGYFWYKGEIGPSNEIARLSLSSNISIPGPVHNGTATIQPNGSLLIKNVTMNHTGVYILQTLNSDFGNEEASLEIHVYHDPNSGLSPGAIAGIVVGVVAGVALIGALAYFLYFRKTGGGSDQNSLTEHTPSASNHSPGPSDNAPKKDIWKKRTKLDVTDFKENLAASFTFLYQLLLKQCASKTPIKNLFSWTSKMAQCITVLAAKPDDLSLIPRTHMMGGEN